MNPAAYPTLYGIVGTMTGGKAVAAALILIAIAGAAARLRTRLRPPAAHVTAAALPILRGGTASRIAVVLGCLTVLTGLTVAG